MHHGMYTGPDKRLFNKGSLLRENPKDSSTWLAQFDPLQLQEAYGWHVFPKTDFVNLYELGSTKEESNE
jgi:hypothetical protein